jgi:hypothetical protein
MLGQLFCGLTTTEYKTGVLSLACLVGPNFELTVVNTPEFCWAQHWTECCHQYITVLFGTVLNLIVSSTHQSSVGPNCELNCVINTSQFCWAQLWTEWCHQHITVLLGPAVNWTVSSTHHSSVGPSCELNCVINTSQFCWAQLWTELYHQHITVLFGPVLNWMVSAADQSAVGPSFELNAASILSAFPLYCKNEMPLWPFYKKRWSAVVFICLFIHLFMVYLTMLLVP